MEHVNVEAVRRAWEQAGDDLGIEVEAGPAQLADVVAVIRHFGQPAGAAILTPESPADARRTAEEHGYFVSVVSTSYEEYERGLFIDTLNDWQWHGTGQPPDWYTGEPW